MIEMALLEPSKETENKLRWSTHIEEDDAPFHFYIPKWRFPEPWPGRIHVEIQPFDGDPSTFVTSSYQPEALEHSIRILVEPVMEHSRTTRYVPVGDREEWQTGEPYIPFSLIPSDAHFLAIEVKWDLSSMGQFVDVPTCRQD